MIKYVLILISLLVFLGFAHESRASDSIYLGGVSAHLEDDRNNINPTLLYQKEGFVGGYFYNSFKTHSIMLGKDFSTSRDGITIGAVPSLIYGYEKNQILAACTNKVCLSVLPYFKFEYNKDWSPTIIIGGTFLTALVEYKF